MTKAATTIADRSGIRNGSACQAIRPFSRSAALQATTPYPNWP
jgi:hypothetical protein